jgi:hypothetical protein
VEPQADLEDQDLQDHLGQLDLQDLLALQDLVAVQDHREVLVFPELVELLVLQGQQV